MEAILKLFGEYFFKFCKMSGYDRMLRTLGGNLTEFIENLDALHSYLALSYQVRPSGLFLGGPRGQKKQALPSVPCRGAAQPVAAGISGPRSSLRGKEENKYPLASFINGLTKSQSSSLGVVGEGSTSEG